MNAKDTDLPSLLSSLGYQVRRIGSYYTTKEMDSLRIKDRRTWYRYSEGKGGDAIDFMQHFEGKTFPEAVDFLLAWNGRSRDSPDLTKRPRLFSERNGLHLWRNLCRLFFLRPMRTPAG